MNVKVWFGSLFQEKTDTEKENEDEPGTGAGDHKEEEKTVGGIGAVEDDLTLRAALYGVLFQSFADKVLPGTCIV